MSGEHGGAGYAFQFWVILQTALESWCSEEPSDVAALLIEGAPGQDSVDCVSLADDGTAMVFTQVRSRGSYRAFSAREIVKALHAMDTYRTSDRARLEFVTNGRLGPSAQKTADLLEQSPGMTDAELGTALAHIGLSDTATSELIRLARAGIITQRPMTSAALRRTVAENLRQARRRGGCPVGSVGAASLRAHLFELLWTKIENSGAGRRLTRAEFLEKVVTPQADLEAALRSRWGVPVGLADQQNCVRRDALMAAISEKVQDEDGDHAADGVVRRCVLAGQAGSGKTTLAQQYALEHAAEFDWIYQVAVQASDQMEPSSAMAGRAFDQLAEWLRMRGIPVDSGTAQEGEYRARIIQQALASWSRRWLLIVDNAIDVGLVTPYLPANGHGVVLITTRDSGWVQPKSLVRIAEMSADEAAETVHRRLHGTGLTFDGEQIAALITRLGYYPLALATATAYLARTHHPMSRFLTDLEKETRRVGVLAHHRARPEDYPLPAAAAIRLSVRYLANHGESDAVRVLQRASVLYPDQIPGVLLEPNITRLSEAMVALAELSLLHRWQDDRDLDWFRIHRLVQDVVRVDLNDSTDELKQLLLAAQRDIVEAINDCNETRDLRQFPILRHHGESVVDHIVRYKLESWSDTTALLSNTAALAGAIGDFVDAERLFRQALSLVPTPSGNAAVEIRRAKTLFSYARLLGAAGRVDEARRLATQACRTSLEHRERPAHAELHNQALCLIADLDARSTTDNHVLKQLYQHVSTIPALSESAIMLKFEAQQSIASRMEWHGGADRREQRESAELWLAYNTSRTFPDQASHADAHLQLAEAHAAANEVDAAWAHYLHAREVYALADGMPQLAVLDRVLDFTHGLSLLPYNQIDGSVLLPDVDSLLVALLRESDELMTDSAANGAAAAIARLRLLNLRLVRATHHADLPLVNRLIAEFHDLHTTCTAQVPPSLETAVANTHFNRLAALELYNQGIRPRPDDRSSTWIPSTSSVNTRACDHGARNFFVVPRWRAAPIMDEAPRVEMSEADDWQAAATHIQLWISWKEEDYLALDRASVESWNDRSLIEMHLVGAGRFISLIVQYYMIRVDREIDLENVCSLLSQHLQAASSQRDDRFTLALSILDLIKNGSGTLQTPKPYAIGHVTDLLRELLSAETILLDAATATSETIVQVALLLMKIAYKESNNGISR